ncbi:MAG TPA: LysM peptidoglycan-binding domain-containing protein [Anaerohalosphaeraceae bacterium]|nr:LysM peptidoglycan-binding domain-containing protein [Phycisphaerae bacterium]HOL31940.1 LysM peptidoglycan-binding domain-containing protein [Anaerohalosphaeraceae bacterium]HOM75896.1 LysM peptidoglycan-binding domain-containing protein [Anaerohalosphaeraceae bacterium]HPC63733.1 LysM peptidoglycan-binding domain-containing protein [Anaerohalosphaeraceae bacterium]HPO69035.1 LysM peptidoglycan-binding domain-containing protein [Anaerohalosphaeraceae bacterium]
MKQQVAAVSIIALICAGIGVGAGVLIMKPKLSQSAKTIEELQLKMQQTKTESEDALQRASGEIVRLKTELSRANSTITQARNDLARATAELARLQAEAQRPAKEADKTSQEEAQTSAVAASQPSTSASPVSAAGSGAGLTPAAPKTAAVEYVVKEGDSLWKIAASQLGSGVRYEEILALNPQLKKDSTLVVGSKIKIPAK